MFNVGDRVEYIGTFQYQNTNCKYGTVVKKYPGFAMHPNEVAVQFDDINYVKLTADEDFEDYHGIKKERLRLYKREPDWEV